MKIELKVGCNGSLIEGTSHLNLQPTQLARSGSPAKRCGLQNYSLLLCPFSCLSCTTVRLCAVWSTLFRQANIKRRDRLIRRFRSNVLGFSQVTIGRASRATSASSHKLPRTNTQRSTTGVRLLKNLPPTAIPMGPRLTLLNHRN